MDSAVQNTAVSSGMPPCDSWLVDGRSENILEFHMSDKNQWVSLRSAVSTHIHPSSERKMQKQATVSVYKKCCGSISCE